MIAATLISVTDDSDATLIEEDGVFYDLYEDDYHAEVIQTFAGTYIGHVEISATIEYGGDTYVVNTISGYAFQGCVGLTSIDLKNVTTIGEGAFEDCTGLTSIDLKNVTSISSYVFNRCVSLRSIDLKGVTSIGYNAFNGCTCITEFKVNDNNDSFSVIDKVLFNNDKTKLIKYTCGTTGQYAVPDDVTSIDDYAFSGCTGLESIVLNDVTAIGFDAFEGCTELGSMDLTGISVIKSDTFSGCTGLTSVNLNGVTDIGDNAFEGCINLESIDLTGVATLGKEVFCGCTGLTLMDIKNVTSIGEGAFSGCTSLEEFKVGEGNTKFSVVGKVLFNYTKTELIAFPCGMGGSYEVPEGVTKISNRAFSGCENIEIINLNKVTDIGNDAFEGCTSLEEFKVGEGNMKFSVDGKVLFNDLKTDLIYYPLGKEGAYIVPDNVTKIDSYAFKDCIHLMSIDLNDVTTIGNYAFKGCTDLESIDLNGVTEIWSGTFKDCTGLKYVDINNVTSISDDAFEGCTGILEFEVNKDNSDFSVIDGVLFNKEGTELVLYPCGKEGAYDVPDGVTTIGDYAFCKCIGLTSIDLKGVTTIGLFSFEDCTGLEYADLTGVTDVYYYAFHGCTKLEYAELEGVKNIYGLAFYGCTSLTSVDLDDVECLDSAFVGCENLTQVTLPSDVPMIGQFLFMNTSPEIVLLVPSSASLDTYLASEEWMPYVNYTFADISKADVSGIVDKTYCGSSIEQSLTLVEGSKTLTADVDYAISYSDNINAGIAKVIITGKGNYAGTSIETFNIIPKSVIVKADDVTRSYYEKDPELTATVTGLIGTDKVAYILVRDAGQSVGTYAIRASGDTIQGNYSVTYQDGTFTITEGTLEKHYDWYYFLWLIPAIQFLFLVLVLIYRTVKKDEEE